MKRLLCLTAALCLALTLAGCKKEDAPVTADAAAQTAPQAEGMTALTLYDGSVTLRFDRGEDGLWVWRDDTDFPLAQEAMEPLLALPAALDGGEPVENAQELSVYGLETPEKYVTATSDGEDVTYYVGSAADDGRWYVLTPDGRVLYAADETKALLSTSIYALAALPQLPVIAPEKLVSVSILSGDGAGASFYVAEDGSRRSGNRDVTAATEAAVAEIGALTLTACVDYEPAEGADEVCGLAEPAVTLAVNYVGDTGADKALTLAIGSAVGEGGRYVRLDSDSTIYRMEETALAAILTLAETGL